jgi:hypothetical protein
VQSLCWLFFAVVGAPSLPAVVLVLSLGYFLKPFHMVGYWTNVLDLSPRFAGPLLGVSNAFASLPGVFANVLTGLVLEATGALAQTGGWGVGTALAHRDSLSLSRRERAGTTRDGGAVPQARGSSSSPCRAPSCCSAQRSTSATRAASCCSPDRAAAAAAA